MWFHSLSSTSIFENSILRVALKSSTSSTNSYWYQQLASIGLHSKRKQASVLFARCRLEKHTGGQHQHKRSEVRLTPPSGQKFLLSFHATPRRAHTRESRLNRLPISKRSGNNQNSRVMRSRGHAVPRWAAVRGALGGCRPPRQKNTQNSSHISNNRPNKLHLGAMFISGYISYGTLYFVFYMQLERVRASSMI